MTVYEIRAERARLHREAHALIDRADEENRGLEDDEREQVDKMLEEIRHLGRRLELAQVGDELDIRDAAVAAPYQTPLEPTYDDDDGETRALGPSESVRSFVARRGWADPTELGDLQLGQYLRSMVVGPRTDIERRALSEGTDSAGGFTVPTILAGDLIDLLRARATVFQAGARTVPLESDKHDIARLASDPVAAWRAENAAVAESDPTFDRVRFEPKSLAVVVRASRELIQDSLNLEAALTRAFTNAFALEVDRVALVGAGSGSEPTGIANATGITEVDLGTDGAAITDYSSVLDMLQALEAANVDTSRLAAIMAPRTARTIAGFADTTGQPLQRPPALERLRTLTTSQVPIDQTQGTSSDASSIYMGDFRAVMVGVRLELQIEVLKERYADNLQFGFLAFGRWDIQFEHAASLGRIVGIVP